MAQDIAKYQAGTLIQHPKTKLIYLITNNSTLEVNRTSLYDVKNNKELFFEVESRRPTVLDESMLLIKPEFALTNTQVDFKKIDLEDAEQYVFTPNETNVVKNHISTIHNPNLYASVLETEQSEIGTKTTTNNPDLIKT